MVTVQPYVLPFQKDLSAEDKKISGGKMHLIVPEKIGSCRIESIDIDALRDWL